MDVFSVERLCRSNGRIGILGFAATSKESKRPRKGQRQKQRWKGQRERKVVKVSCPVSRRESKIPPLLSIILVCVCTTTRFLEAHFANEIDRFRVKLFHLSVSMQPCSLEITMEYEAMRQVQSVSVYTSMIVAVGSNMLGIPLFQHVGRAICDRL